MSVNGGEGRSLEPKILVFGLGGTGCNAVNNMINGKLEGVTFCVANTDAQALNASLAEQKIQLGAELTQGLGAGSDPEIGRKAAEESAEAIEEMLKGNHMVFITAGMGGGTGTGAAHVVAKIAKDMGVLTVGVVTKPFHFEGARRMSTALLGIEALEPNVDTMLVIPNQNLFRIASNQTTFTDAFKMADNVLDSGIRGITDLVTRPGLINLDFADIRSVMRNMGAAMMGTGEAEGENRAIDAVEMAISNPLLDHSSMKGAKAVLFNITGSSNLTLFELDEAANRVREEVDPNANIIVGSAFNPDLDNKIKISIFATGIDIEQRSEKANDPFRMKQDDVKGKKNGVFSDKAEEKDVYTSNKKVEGEPMFDEDEIEKNSEASRSKKEDGKSKDNSISKLEKDTTNAEGKQNEQSFDEEEQLVKSINNGAPFKGKLQSPAEYEEDYSNVERVKYPAKPKDEDLNKNKTNRSKKSFFEKMSLGFNKIVSGGSSEKPVSRGSQDERMHTPAFIRRKIDSDENK